MALCGHTRGPATFVLCSNTPRPEFDIQPGNISIVLPVDFTFNISTNGSQVQAFVMNADARCAPYSRPSCFFCSVALLYILFDYFHLQTEHGPNYRPEFAQAGRSFCPRNAWATWCLLHKSIAPLPSLLPWQIALLPDLTYLGATISLVSTNVGHIDIGLLQVGPVFAATLPPAPRSRLMLGRPLSMSCLLTLRCRWQTSFSS